MALARLDSPAQPPAPLYQHGQASCTPEYIPTRLLDRLRSPAPLQASHRSRPTRFNPPPPPPEMVGSASTAHLDHPAADASMAGASKKDKLRVATCKYCGAYSLSLSPLDSRRRQLHEALGTPLGNASPASNEPNTRCTKTFRIFWTQRWPPAPSL